MKMFILMAALAAGYLPTARGASPVAVATPRLSASSSESPDISVWLQTRVPSAEAFLRLNLSPNGYRKGFVIAAPWVVPHVQDYRYHWIRDAALVMNTMVTRYIETRGTDAQRAYFELLANYAQFSSENQHAPEPSGVEVVGLGEVKFNSDGTRFTAWMRPQNDGPALRSITLIRFARELLVEGREDLARFLYNGSDTEGRADRELNAASVIATDLNYLSSHWSDLSFDPWEEVKGHHFYTRLLQRKALLDGADLSRRLGDENAATQLLASAREIEAALTNHWIPAGSRTPSGAVSRGQIWDTFDRAGGVDYKSTGLDVAAILGALHAHNELDASDDHFFSASDDRILQTAFELSSQFAHEYPIARQQNSESNLGTPIGRYPGDRFNGYDASGHGNPWFLATAAFAELYYRCAREWTHAGHLTITSVNKPFLLTLTTHELKENETLAAGDPRFLEIVRATHALGDRYLRRFKYHEGDNGHLNEEFSRENGFATGAEDLSWSYASVLSAASQR